MGHLGADEAAEVTGGEWHCRGLAEPLGPCCIDTRLLRPGEIFVALKTPVRDGHDFLETAAEKGAQAALVEKADRDIDLPQLQVADSLKGLQQLADRWRSHFRGPVIGITGSYGKTTVKEMLSHIMGQQWFRTEGNLNNHIGVPLNILRLDPFQHAGAILEAGINAPGEMDLLAGLIRPDIALFTGVGPAHLEKLGSVEGVAREKSRLAAHTATGGLVFMHARLLEHSDFRNLPEAVRAVVLVREGAESASLVEGLGEKYSIYHYKWTEAADSEGTGELLMESPVSAVRLRLRARSDGMVANFALVVAVARHLGVPESTLEARFDSWKPPKHRGQEVMAGRKRYFVDCYNANPDSMVDSVQRFCSHYRKYPKVFVLGGMNELGENSAELHSATAARLQIPDGSKVIFMGEYRSQMSEGLRSTGFPSENIFEVEDLKAVKRQLKRVGDAAILLKASRSYALERLLEEDSDAR